MVVYYIFYMCIFGRPLVIIRYILYVSALGGFRLLITLDEYNIYVCNLYFNFGVKKVISYIKIRKYIVLIRYNV